MVKEKNDHLCAGELDQLQSILMHMEKTCLANLLQILPSVLCNDFPFLHRACLKLLLSVMLIAKLPAGS